MYDRADEAGLAVAAGAILPYNTATPDQNRRMHEINSWIREQAFECPRRAFVNTRAAVANPGDVDRLADTPDGLHPSPAGYRRMADVIRPVVEWLLESG
jgi:lysophospholipase L1-like esterase